jgi:hypothetical protein
VTFLFNAQATGNQVRKEDSMDEEKKDSETLMLDFEKINGVQAGTLPTTTKVGSACVDGNWRAVFLQTRKSGEVVVNKRGEVQFNVK